MASILVDTTITLIVFGSVYEGYRRGLVTNLLSLAGFGTVLLLCLTFGELLGKPLKPYIPFPETYSTLAAYIAICFVIALVAFLLHGVFSKLLTRRLPPAVDVIGGMFVGALRGAVFTALCLVILILIANPMINENIYHGSRIGATFFKEVSKVSPTVEEMLTSCSSPLKAKAVVREKSEHDLAVEAIQGSGHKK
jgi:uncharacterized membrane protein required for colicin V production